MATPKGFELPDEVVDQAAAVSQKGAGLTEFTDPKAAVRDVDAVYTDVWTSMGQEAETALRLEAFSGFTVTDDLMAVTAPGSVFLHCLPAHRGEEVTHDVLEGSRSRVWPQAENRMHAARGAMRWLLEQR